ncbi:MAG: CapA family protein [Christensenellales bacterium]|jgi:uncharacterized protein YjdB
MKRLLIGLTLLCLLLAAALPASAAIEPKVAVRSVRLNKSFMALSPETTGKLTAKIYPSRAPKAVEYVSTDTTVATVDAAGNVTAVDYGICAIIAKAGKKTAQCNVVVKDIPVGKVNIKKSSLTISLNRSVALTYAVTPAAAKNKTLNWSSSNETVATVSQDGKVTAVGKGKAIITAEAMDGSGKKDTCKITVKAVDVKSIAIATGDSVYLDIGESMPLTAKISPTNASYKDVKWSSSNPEVVSINEDTGIAKAMGGGVATIMATVQNGTKSAKQLLYVRSSDHVTLTITFGGDVVLGGDPREDAKTYGTIARFKEYLQENGNDLGFMFRGLKSVFDDDDLTVVNLECPLTTRTSWPNIARQRHVFRGHPSYARGLLLGGVNAVSIRNNMVPHLGRGGITDTKNSITEHTDGKVTWFSNEETIIERKGTKIGLIGFFQGSDKIYTVKNRVTALRPQCDLLIVYFHWSNRSGSSATTKTMRKLAHTAVTAGADICVGAGPHCLSGIENYKGKYIVYGLGNLISGGRTNENETILYQQTFKVHRGFTEVGKQEIIGVFQTDEPKKLFKWQPLLMTKDADKVRLIEKLRKYSKGFANPGI